MKSVSWEEAVLWLRSQPDQQELVQACYYDDPLIEAARRFAASDEWKAVVEYLPRTKGRALDLGAGRGISSYALASLGWQVDALEPDASDIVGRGAIRQLANDSQFPIKVLGGFAENVPANAGTYDLVYGRQVMHHAQNLRKMCGEIVRVVKRGGALVATREHVISRKDDLPAFLSGHPLHHLYGGENAYLLQEYLDTIEGAGLRIRHVLGPFDSAINYFPMSRSDWQLSIENGLRRRIGPLLSSFLLAGFWPWSKIIYQWAAAFASRLDETPGRLYTFVAQKA